MKTRKSLNKTLISLIILASVTSAQTTFVHADSFKSVTVGHDLTQQQKDDMLKYFGVTKDSANITEVTSEEEHKYLGDTAGADLLGNKSISCSYIEPTSSGDLKVETNNVNWVNANMIKNALITAGVENANVKVSAPFEVSGTAALTGILKGFENNKNGAKLDENRKKVANEEVSTTGKLGQEIGQDKASGLMNEIKTDVIKQDPKDEQAVRDIVLNVTKNYNYNLSKDDIDSIVKLMTNISKLNLNYSNIKDQLAAVTDHLKGTLKQDEVKGFLAKLFSAIGDFFNKMSAGLK